MRGTRPAFAVPSAPLGLGAGRGGSMAPSFRGDRAPGGRHSGVSRGLMGGDLAGVQREKRVLPARPARV